MEIDNIDVKCKVCNLGNDEDKMLLCDQCDEGFHTDCIGMKTVPKGSWNCPKCVKSDSSNSANVPNRKLRNGHLYLRVSSENQDQEEYGRVGLYTQYDSAMDYCRKNMIIITTTTKEIGSAWKNKTPELDKLINKVKKEECIIVWSFNRFSRNVENCNSKIEKLHAKGSYVLSITENKTSLDPDFIGFIKAGEIESKLLSQRRKDSIKRIKEQGGYIGVKPFGYNIVRINGIRKLKENKVEQQICQNIRKMSKTLDNRKILNAVKIKYHRYTWNINTINNIINCTISSKYQIIKSENYLDEMIEAIDEIHEENLSEIYTHEKYVPEKIIRIRMNKKKYQFLVSWVNSDEKTWENINTFYEDIPEMVKEYLLNNYSNYTYKVKLILGIE